MPDKKEEFKGNPISEKQKLREEKNLLLKRLEQEVLKGQLKNTEEFRYQSLLLQTQMLESQEKHQQQIIKALDGIGRILGELGKLLDERMNVSYNSKVTNEDSEDEEEEESDNEEEPESQDEEQEDSYKYDDEDSEDEEEEESDNEDTSEENEDDEIPEIQVKPKPLPVIDTNTNFNKPKPKLRMKKDLRKFK